MAVLAYKQHDIYIDIKTSKIKSFQHKKIKNGLGFVDTVPLYNREIETFF